MPRLSIFKSKLNITKYDTGTTKCPASKRKIQKYIGNTDHHLEPIDPDFVVKIWKFGVGKNKQPVKDNTEFKNYKK